MTEDHSFVDVDRAAYVSVETRVEETGRILQKPALGEGKLHGWLARYISACPSRYRACPHDRELLVRVLIGQKFGHETTVPGPDN